MPDIPSVREAYGRTALARLLRDPGLRALAEALSGGQENLGRALFALYAERVEAGDVAPVIDVCLRPLRAASVSVTLHGVDPGELAAGMIAAERADDDPWALAAEHLGVLAVLEFEDAPAAVGALDLLLGVAAPEARIEGVDPTPRAWRGVTAGVYLALCWGAGQEDALLRRLRGQEPGLAPLAGTGDAVGSRLKRAGVTVLEGFSSLTLDLSASPELAPMTPLLYLAEGFLGPPAACLLRGGSWHVGLLEDGRFLTEGLHPLPAEHAPAAIFGAGPLDESVLGLQHPQALVTWAARLDPASLEGLLPDLLDSEFSADLMGSLGSTLIASLLAPRSLVTVPPLLLAMPLEDHETFVRAWEGLLGELEGRGGVRIDRSKYRKVPLYTLRFSATLPGLPFDIGRFLKPTLAVLEDCVLVCVQPNQTKREVSRILTRDPEAHAARERIDLPQEVAEVATADWMRYLGRIYSKARTILPLLATELTDTLGVDADSLPDVEHFTRHFQPSLRWKRVEQGAVRHHLESSFGPEVGLALALAALWVSVSAPQLTEESARAPAGTERPANGQSRAAGITREELGVLRTALTLYRLDQGHLPADLEQLTLTTSGYPGGFLNGRPLAQDGWQRAFRYTLEDGTYRLWSTGADGIDQNGGGDDLRAD